MQLTSRYLLNEKTVLISDESGFVTEYRKLYQRNLTVTKGIDNILTFVIKNADQKPVSILNTYTPKIHIFDENDTLIMTKMGTIIETSTPNYVGQFTVNISGNDLLNIDGQFLKYVAFLTKDSTLDDTLTYANPHFGSHGVIQVDATAFPGPLASYNIKQFTLFDNDEYISETIDGQPAINGNEALHTAAVYTTGFTGDVTIQGTLDNQITEATKWADISTTTLTNPTNPVPINFYGIFSHVRVKYTKTSGTMDQILVRN